MAELDSIIEKLASTTIGDVAQEKTISFAGKTLNLETEQDAENIVKEINGCLNMTTLCLEGNTIGVPSARIIGKALESQSNFKKALWRDIFTRRTENEIPNALRCLSNGVMSANAHLTVLDLSDNAFGSRGLRGITELLSSPACFTLNELYLNNNGLGTAGAEMLSFALSECLANSEDSEVTFRLKVFVCGRNRLENKGCSALAAVLKNIKTLERIEMPQNGIYYEGVQCLSKCLTTNENLTILNLEDNCFVLEGAEAIAEHLPFYKNVEVLNFADCLMRSDGAKLIAKALQESCPKLRELDLGYNEIDLGAGQDIINAVANKKNLEKLILNGNQFGTEGAVTIQKLVEAIGKKDCFGSLSDNESADEDDNDEENDDNEEEDDEENYEDENVIENYSNGFKVNILADFVQKPTDDKLLKIHELEFNVDEEFTEEMTLKEFFDIFVMTAFVFDPTNEKSKEAACYFANNILSFAFKNFSALQVWQINLAFASCLGVVKDADTKVQSTEELKQVFLLLQLVAGQTYFPKTTLLLIRSLLSNPRWAANEAAQALYECLKEVSC